MSCCRMGTSIHTILLAATNLNPTYSIRNYMSKSWFLDVTMEAEPTPLAKQISSILRKTD